MAKSKAATKAVHGKRGKKKVAAKGSKAKKAGRKKHATKNATRAKRDAARVSRALDALSSQVKKCVSTARLSPSKASRVLDSFRKEMLGGGASRPARSARLPDDGPRIQAARRTQAACDSAASCAACAPRVRRCPETRAPFSIRSSTRRA